MTLRIDVDRTDNSKQVIDAVLAAYQVGGISIIEVITTGIGAAVYDRLRERRLPVRPIDHLTV